MKACSLFFCFAFVLLHQIAFGQSKQNDIPVSQLPKEVRQVLNKYVDVLLQSSDLEECADKFVALAGGSLVNEDGTSLRASVKPYSLKKDFQNIRFYVNPIKITRVNLSYTNGTGFGQSAIKGKVYKVWIAKAAEQAGMPAPISIIVPEGHSTISSPKIIKVGSL